MTYKEKKEFLSGYLIAERSLRSSLMEYERWEAIGTKVNRALSMAPCKSDDDKSKVEKAAIEMASLLDGIRAEIQEAEQTKVKIIEAINKMPKARYRELLRYRFIGKMSYEKIAEMLGKDTRTVKRVMESAISNFNP